jgi:ABC-type proline/glycine betaine transport system permease subunit
MLGRVPELALQRWCQQWCCTLTGCPPILKRSKAGFAVAFPNILDGAQAIPCDGCNLTHRSVQLQQSDDLPMALLYILAGLRITDWRCWGWKKCLVVRWF